jgi:RHS repeat-associated protein
VFRSSHGRPRRMWVLLGTIVIMLVAQAAAAKSVEFPLMVPPPSGGDLVAGTEGLTLDTELFERTGAVKAGWEEAFAVAHSRAWLALEVKPYEANPLREGLRAKLKVQVRSRWATPLPEAERTASRTVEEAERVESVILSVDYFPEAGTRYRTKDLYVADKAQYLWFVVQEFTITDSEGMPITDAEILRHISLNARVQEERYYIPQLTEAPTVRETPVLNPSGELQLRWEALDWAERYELEWTHVNDYDGSGVTNLPLPPEGLPPYDFRFESTRVPVTETSYSLPLVYERGYLLWRVRGVGRIGEDFSQPVSGKWSAFNKDTGTLTARSGSPFPSGGSGTSVDSPWVVAIPGHGGNETRGITALNWLHIATFAEGGKRKDVVSYLDGSLRNRQAVTKLNTDDTLLVSETIYDHRGRVAVEMLPSPMPDDLGRLPTLGYQVHFNHILKLDDHTGRIFRAPYTYRDFEIRNSDAPATQPPFAQPLETTKRGAGRYFSPNNPDRNGHQAYVPDAHGRPFVHRIYTPDDTGRVQAESLPGEHHQLGSGHERKYHYGVPDQKELDRLFGNDAGLAQHYKKRLFIDPNGQASVEYMDPAGRVVATGLAGDAPETLLPVDNHPATPTTINLLETTSQKVPGKPELSSSKTLLVTKDNTAYSFVYRFTPPDLDEATCARAPVCYDCVYDLDIQVVDGGAELVTFVNTAGEQQQAHWQERIGSLEELGTCSDRDSQPVELTFSLSLQRGSYRVIKRLLVNEAALEQYVDDFIETNACLPEIQERLRVDLERDYDPGQCKTPCTSCNLDTFSETVEVKTDTGKKRVEFDAEQRTEMAGACSRSCNADPATTPCESGYQAMLADVNRGGQYAGYLTDGGRIDPAVLPLSVLNDSGDNGLPVSYADWRHPIGAYRNADGSPSRIPIPEDDPALCIAGRETAEGECRPEHLNRVEDFLRLWKQSWAEALVSYHPEYGYYRWCRDNEAIMTFDAELRAIDTFAKAKAANRLNPFRVDPLFRDPSRAFLLRKRVNFVDTHCGGPRRELAELVHLTVSCNNPNFSEAEAEACVLEAMRRTHPNPVGSDPELADDEWRIFRDVYLTERAAVVSREREKFIRGRDGFFVNTCIGDDDPGRCPGPMNHADYQKKTKRFADDRDALALLPEGDCEMQFNEVVVRQQYETCGKCPQQTDLEALLSAAASSGRLTKNFELPRFPVIPTKRLLDAFPSPGLRRYQWDGKDLGQVLDIQIKGEGREQCRIVLGKTDADVAWEDLQWIGWVAPHSADSSREPEGASNNFKAKGVLKEPLPDGRQTIALEGDVSCLNLTSCNLPRLCEAAPDMAAEIAQFTQFLMERPFASEILLHAPDSATDRLGEMLRAFGHGPEWSWKFLRWGIEGVSDTTDRRAFTGQLESGAGEEFNVSFCPLTFRMLTSDHTFVEEGLSIRSVREVYKDGATDATACNSSVIHLNATAANGDPIVIEVTSACHQFGECCVTPSCPSPIEVRGPPGMFPRITPIVPRVSPPLRRLPLSPTFPPRLRSPIIPGGTETVPPPTLTNLPACDRCCLEPFPSIPYRNPCADSLKQSLDINVKRQNEEIIKDFKKSIRELYLKRCLSAKEFFEASFSERMYHFTLFYYDQAGNLIRTVPPKGVNLLTATQIDQVQAHREDMQAHREDRGMAREDSRADGVYPVHTFATVYHYNTFNELTEKTTPDSGTTRSWYDRLGRPVISQDARQRAEGHVYGYVIYDPLGRITEAGEILGPGTMSSTTARDEEELKNWRIGGTRTEYTLTQYDEPLSREVNGYFEDGQQYLRKRVASLTRHRIDADRSTYRHATHFSYDVHGNVKTLIQDNPQMPDEHQLKTINYDYDLVSGNLNKRIYQPNQPDQFIHHYTYDADNRLVALKTSTNGIIWDRDAEYTYYDHGPLARLELGEERVQGIDYAYTILGTLKGVNTDSLKPERDIGRDGLNDPTLGDRTSIPPDAFGYSLGYHEGDYQPIGPFTPETNFVARTAGSSLGQHGRFDGTITHLVTAIGAFSDEQKIQGAAYQYDQLARLRDMDVYREPDLHGNSWQPAQPVRDYETRVTYDPNGNIQTLTRNGAGASRIDDLRYRYQADTNRLTSVFDRSGSFGWDLSDQPPNNYAYDASGRMTRDQAAGIHNIQWTATDKVRRVEKATGTLEFAYDAAGRRVMKRDGEKTLWYVLDATGAIMSIYSEENGQVHWDSSPIYGHQRLGSFQPHRELDVTESGMRTRTRGDIRYELVNHLGTINSLVSDRKLPNPTGDTGTATPYRADIHAAQDYYPFGMVQPGRKLGQDYRFGFQGMEQDMEIKGSGNSYTTEFRQYDPRVARWLSVDPKAEKYPGTSPFVAFGNSPTNFKDFWGLECTGHTWVGPSGATHCTEEPDPEFFSDLAEGAVLGEFSNASGPGVAWGQTIVGLTPAGLVADVRDISAAVAEVAEEEDPPTRSESCYVMNSGNTVCSTDATPTESRLVVSVVAVIWGLDWLKSIRMADEVGEIAAGAVRAGDDLPGATRIVNESGDEIAGAADPAFRTGWVMRPNDLDWRGTGRGAQDALDEAFRRTGLPREQFQVTKWGRDAHGKSFPVEWTGPGQRQVNIDAGHINEGPGVPHVGWERGRRRTRAKGHILVDEVPYNRDVR